ncbi:hypothetical protein [Mangrovicoccus ximenensis]|uniref:hypothetical protein n=1 Tax=Mangrovicoccus ximenensis TaxID=1911570 RepID=UPI0011AE4BD0|nr:hypothetical protein [Mangrovicoccus ximenensis]
MRQRGPPARRPARGRGPLEPELTPLLPAPFRIDTLCLAGADEEDRFHLIERIRLTGRPES